MTKAQKIQKVRRTMMALFTALALMLSGQTWSDAKRGDGEASGSLLPLAKMLFPQCKTEDSNNCVWDNGDGYPFFTFRGVTIIFTYPDCGDTDRVPCETWDEGARWLVLSYHPYRARYLSDK